MYIYITYRIIFTSFYPVCFHIYKKCMAHNHIFLTGSLPQPLHEKHITAWCLSSRSKYGRGIQNEKKHDKKRFWADNFSLACFPWSHLPMESCWYYLFQPGDTDGQ